MKRYVVLFSIFIALSAATNAAYAASFKGKQCKGNCSGHKAGYSWAKSKGIAKSSHCGRRSGKSFQEGCRSAVKGH